MGRPHGGFSNCGCMDPFRTQAPHQCSGAHSGNIGPPSLCYSITGQSCFDSNRQYHCCGLHQQTGWDPFPPPVAAGSGSVSVVTDSGHHSMSQIHLGLPKCDSRPVFSAEPAHHDRVESPPEVVNLIFRLWGTPVVDMFHYMFATVHNTNLPQFMSPVLEPRALAIDALSLDWQGRSMFPPFHLLNKVIQKLRTTQTGDTHPSLVAVTSVVSTPATTECGSSTILSVPHRPVFTTGLYLEQQVVPSARMEALMQHYQAAGFSKEVSRLAAAPRRPSTNRMYDDRWLCFANWATGKRFDPLGPTAAQIAAFLYELFDTHGL